MITHAARVPPHSGVPPFVESSPMSQPAAHSPTLVGPDGHACTVVDVPYQCRPTLPSSASATTDTPSLFSGFDDVWT